MEDMVMKKDVWEDNRILITGHEGFLGAFLSRTLVEKGAHVIGIDKVKNRPYSMLKGIRSRMISLKGDITNFFFLRKAIRRYRPEIIFHLAAEAIVEKGMGNPVKAFKSNIEGTWNLLEASRGNGRIKAIIVASSDKAYGTSKKLPYREDTPLCGEHPYDVSKSCADLITFTYFNTYNLPVCVTRCGNIYGPGDYHFSRIIPETIRCALTGKRLNIRSNGKFVRDYVYVEDIVNGYMMLAEKMLAKDIKGEAFNFSCEEPRAVLDIVKCVYRLLRKKPYYKILNIVTHEIEQQYLSSKKARRLLSWRPRYTLIKGLENTINWYRGIFNKKNR